MGTEEFRLFLIFFIGVMVTMGAVTKVIITWIKRPRPHRELPSDVAERLERIERAVESTAIEVERIGDHAALVDFSRRSAPCGDTRRC